MTAAAFDASPPGASLPLASATAAGAAPGGSAGGAGVSTVGAAVGSPDDAVAGTPNANASPSNTAGTTATGSDTSAQTTAKSSPPTATGPGPYGGGGPVSYPGYQHPIGGGGYTPHAPNHYYNQYYPEFYRNYRPPHPAHANAYANAGSGPTSNGTAGQNQGQNGSPSKVAANAAAAAAAHHASTEGYNPYRYGDPSTIEATPHFTERHIVPMSDPQDGQVLSEFLTFVRADCLELFDSAHEGQSLATMEQSTSQVGVRCRFCAHIPRRNRAPRSQSYPSTLSRIYQSLTMMMREHFPKCQEMPKDVALKFDTLKKNPKSVGSSVTTPDGVKKKKKAVAHNRLSGAGSGLGNAARYTKNYWTESAQRMGLYDSPDGKGIRYHNIKGVISLPSASASASAATASAPPMEMMDEDTEDAINAAIDAAETAREEPTNKRRKVDDVAEDQGDPIETEAV